MTAIFKKEFRSYFTSPIGYIVMAVLFCFSGYFFVNANIMGGYIDMSPVFSNMLLILIIVIPILTMRIFSEEKRQKTDQLLLTSRLSLAAIVIGKFLAAMVVLTLALSVTFIYAAIISFSATPNWIHIISNYIGLLLIGGFVIAIGTLISSLTESQMIAAMGTFGVSFFFLYFEALTTELTQNKVLSSVLGFFSIQQRYASFINGSLSYNNFIYFISMQALFLFLTVRVLDYKRWS